MRLPPSTNPGRAVRRAAATRAVLLTAALSRRLRLGSGSTVGGRVGLVIDPGLLATAGAGRTVALVSGTNGKTTTTRLLAAALSRAPGCRGPGDVATSQAGANMPTGLVSALLAAPTASYAALEVDESYLGQAAAALRPSVIVLLNLSRDQLDRVSEVRRVAARWRDVLAGTDAVVVANADDPLVVWAASAAPATRYVAAGSLWRADAYHCPSCDARLAFAPDPAGGWSCGCGLARPSCVARLDGDQLVLADGGRLHLDLALPGRFNRANGALAAVAAAVVGVPPADAVSAMRGVTEVAGRFATFEHGGRRLRLLLAKNPAGFDELLALVAGCAGPVVMAVNARDADGRDPSWLWDVPFERLAGRHVVASGERRLDVAVRLRHAGVDHEVADDPLAALAGSGAADVDVIANYTAFQELRRRLAHPGSGHPWSGARPAPAADPLPAGAPPRGAASSGCAAARRHGADALRIVVVHPDLLGTYGDGGNALVLANRARWRGVEAEVVLAPSDVPLPEAGDLYCLGGGEDGPQAHAAEVLAAGGLARAVERGAAVLAVCAGFQILGEGFPGANGRRQPGLGLLDVDTARTGERRAVGEVLVRPVAGAVGGLGQEPLSGFENHAARTRRGAGAAPLGQVLRGTGNDGSEDGAVQGRIVATYLHGPVLARNPSFADALLGLVLGSPLEPLDDAEEAALRAERLRAIAPPGRRIARIG